MYAVSALATLSTVNKEDDMGRTPLHLAAAVGETATVRELVKRHGADLQHSTSQVGHLSGMMGNWRSRCTRLLRQPVSVSAGEP